MLRPTVFRPCIFLACSVVAGCTHIATTQERIASFAPYADTRIAGEPVPAFLFARVAFLISGAEVKTEKAIDGQIAGAELIVGNPDHLAFGSATPIDRRGYFLTAAHCVANEPVYLMSTGTNGQKSVARASVVWRAPGGKDELDLAVLRIEQPVEWTLEWDPIYHRSEAVVFAGLNYDKLQNYDFGCAAGRITRIDLRPKATPPFEYIYHQAPVHGGDSGGPLTTPDGKLIAINTGGGSIRLGPFSYFVGRAERPDLGWLQRLINADCARHAVEKDPEPQASAAH